ncbi:hypothetical protein QS788_26070, partial [Escherichia coli]|nr:hypothetical protein [Escherichia coli]MDL8277138.1 hypothetical protein [Escherichia coli]
MIHIGEEGAQKTDTSNLQGNAQTVVITSAFSDKFLVCFIKVKISGTVAKLAMRQPFVLFKGLTFQKLCLPGAFRPGDHHN